MEKEAVQFPLSDYTMQLGGGQYPRIQVVLSKATPPVLKGGVAELPYGLPKVELKISTDSHSDRDQGRLTVLVTIEATAGHTILQSVGRKDGVTAICCVSSLHPPNTANFFFENCQNFTAKGEEVPVTILDADGNQLCILRTGTVSRFSWTEMTTELRGLIDEKRREGTAPVQ